MIRTENAKQALLQVVFDLGCVGINHAIINRSDNIPRRKSHITHRAHKLAPRDYNPNPAAVLLQLLCVCGLPRLRWE